MPKGRFLSEFHTDKYCCLIPTMLSMFTVLWSQSFLRSLEEPENLVLRSLSVSLGQPFTFLVQILSFTVCRTWMNAAWSNWLWETEQRNRWSVSSLNFNKKRQISEDDCITIRFICHSNSCSPKFQVIFLLSLSMISNKGKSKRFKGLSKISPCDLEVRTMGDWFLF